MKVNKKKFVNHIFFRLPKLTKISPKTTTKKLILWAAVTTECVHTLPRVWLRKFSDQLLATITVSETTNKLAFSTQANILFEIVFFFLRKL